MNKFSWMAVAACMVLCMPASTRADTVVLQNGRTLEGRIIEQTDDYLEIKLGSGKMKLKRSDVKSFEVREPAEGYSKADLPELKEEAAPQETPKPAAADIRLKAEYKEGRVYVSGTSNYPNNTPLRVYFMKGETVITVKESRVKRGEFYVAFGPFEKEVMAGKYSVAAEALTENGKAYSEPFALTIGTVERVKVDEIRAREYLSDVAQEAGNFYSELNKAFEKNKVSGDGYEWKEWSKKWSRRVYEAGQKFEENSKAYLISLHPVSQRRLQFCFHQLPLLLRAYTIELNSEGAKPVEQVLPVQDVQALRGSFERALSETMQDVSAVAADLNRSR